MRLPVRVQLYEPSDSVRTRPCIAIGGLLCCETPRTVPTSNIANITCRYITINMDMFMYEHSTHRETYSCCKCNYNCTARERPQGVVCTHRASEVAHVQRAYSCIPSPSLSLFSSLLFSSLLFSVVLAACPRLARQLAGTRASLCWFVRLSVLRRANCHASRSMCVFSSLQPSTRASCSHSTLVHLCAAVSAAPPARAVLRHCVAHRGAARYCGVPCALCQLWLREVRPPPRPPCHCSRSAQSHRSRLQHAAGCYDDDP